MTKQIERVAVLGAGTMGARIAAHLANAGFPVLLLDILPAAAAAPGNALRNQVAATALAALLKSKPAALFEPQLARLITPGNFADDLHRLAEMDWIIEAVVEDLEVKRGLLRRVEEFRKPGAIITSNTSGLPLHKIAEDFPPDFQRCWFGTHFFNPPRYMRLLEIIPTPQSDPQAMAAVAHLCDVRLGKGVVHAHDTPNFIANRVGTFSVLNVMRVMQEMDLTIEEVDALTGSTLGWPRSATFRTIDMVGLDILGHVVRNMTSSVRDERSELQLPDFFHAMLQKKTLGDKTNGGFYKKIKAAPAESRLEEQRLALDWKTGEYRPHVPARLGALDMAKNVEDTGERLRMLLNGDQRDKAQRFYWAILSDLWTYAANRIPEISGSIVEIDRAMHLGFNWEMGPFELWDAAGVPATVSRMKAEGAPVAANVEKLLAAGKTSWYIDAPEAPSAKAYFDLDTGAYKNVEVPSGVMRVETAKKSRATRGARPSQGVVRKNPGCSLVDLGEGVACLEFHTRMNSLGTDIVQFVTETLSRTSSSDQFNGGADFEAFVITNDAAHFSAGANIMMLLLSIQEEEWDDIDFAIRGFQKMTQAIKFSPKPVVSAPFGMTLGGGAEICLHSAARNPHAELYLGLVEVGVGLLPGGGGCKEMTIRALKTAGATTSDGARGFHGESVTLMDSMKQTFETVATARVSTSAAEARTLGFLADGDRITMNRERVLADAKAYALELARGGFKPPVMKTDIPAPGENILATLKLGVHIMRQGGYISDHDQKIGNKVAEVLCGGAVHPGSPVTEQDLLDLEREGFKSLCGEKRPRNESSTP